MTVVGGAKRASPAPAGTSPGGEPFEAPVSAPVCRARGALRLDLDGESRQHDPQRRAPDSRSEARRHLERAAVDRGCLRARLRGAAAGRGQPCRPLWPQAPVPDRADRIRLRIDRSRLQHVGRDADRLAGGDGGRRGDDDAGDALDHQRPVPRPRRALARNRALGRYERRRDRDRPDRRRTAAGALLVGIGVLGERPDRVGGAVAAVALVPDSKNPNARRPDPVGGLLSILGLGAILWAIIEAPAKGWLSAEVVAVGARRARRDRAVPRLGSTQHPPDVEPRVLPAPAASRLQPRRSPSASSRSSVRCSCRPSSSSSTSGSPRSRPVSASFPWPRSSRWPLRCRPWSSGGSAASSSRAPACSRSAGGCSGSAGLRPGDDLRAVRPRTAPARARRRARDADRDRLGHRLGPAGEAGVGSATNGVSIQVGGALGVAVIGSILSTRYQHHLTSSLGGTLPAAAFHTALGSIGGALEVAATLPGVLARSSRRRPRLPS